MFKLKLREQQDFVSPWFQIINLSLQICNLEPSEVIYFKAKREKSQSRTVAIDVDLLQFS